MTTSRAVPNRRLVATVLLLVIAGALLAFLPGVAWAADPARDRQWPLDVVGAGDAHAVGRGGGATIAVVDSGVDLVHEDLVENLVAGIDLVDGDDTPQDEFGHGTHVAGIAAAVGDNGRGIDSVAPAARIMPVRVLDADGTGSSRDVADGVRWAVDHGADVVNLSLGEAGQQVLGSSLAEVVRYAWERGVIVVVAAGNEFVLSSGFEDEPALVVSATTRDDRKPDYSNGVGNARWGIAAPGGGCALLSGCPREDDVFSTYWEEGRSDVYAYSQGTSMAAPHVAGAAAVLRSLGLTPRAVVDRLLATAEDLGPSGRDSTYGAGRLDLAAAVAGLAPPTEEPTESGPGQSAAPSPAASPAPGGPAPGRSPAGDGSAQQSPTPSPAVAPSVHEEVGGTPTPASSPSPPARGPTPSPSPSAGVLGAPADPGDGLITVLAGVLLAAAIAGLVGAFWARGRGRW